MLLKRYSDVGKKSFIQLTFTKRVENIVGNIVQFRAIVCFSTYYSIAKYDWHIL